DIRAVVRFSSERDVPALSMYAKIPTAFQLSVIPKAMAGPTFGANVKLGSAVLDERFLVKAVNLDEIEALLATEEALPLLESLCCSTTTILEINRGRVE